MAGGRQYPSGGPHLDRSDGAKIYRGSRKRLRRIKWYEHTSIEFWILVVLVLFMLFGVIPYMIRHPPDESHQRIGEMR